MATRTDTTPRPASTIRAATSCLLEANDDLNRGLSLVEALRLSIEGMGADRDEKAGLLELLETGRDRLLTGRDAVETVRDELNAIADAERLGPPLEQRADESDLAWWARMNDGRSPEERELMKAILQGVVAGVRAPRETERGLDLMGEQNRSGLLMTYRTWLQMELRHLDAELFPDRDLAREMEGVIAGNRGLSYHLGEAPASARAALVLGAVGCAWGDGMDGLARYDRGAPVRKAIEEAAHADRS